jgi:DNA phosphorothioation-dependent restriction protein DptG
MTRTDNDTTLSELKAKVKDFNHARNWEQFHTPKEVAISIVIEASELLEIFQWQTLSRSDVKFNKNKIAQIEEEVADLLIYIFSLSNTLELDLSNAVLTKLDKNAKKYPKVTQKN